MSEGTKLAETALFELLTTDQPLHFTVEDCLVYIASTIYHNISTARWSVWVILHAPLSTETYMRKEMHCLLGTHSSPQFSCTDISSFHKLSPTNPHHTNAILYIWNPIMYVTARLKQLVMAVDTRLRSMLHYEEQTTKGVNLSFNTPYIYWV